MMLGIVNGKVLFADVAAACERSAAGRPRRASQAMMVDVRDIERAL
jgi:hypothetical protein